MATYVVSDLHGQLKAFNLLLEKMGFKWNGEDQLYLLGDYVDWGPEPLKTLIYIMELKKEYDFIHPLIGNHDLILLEHIQKEPTMSLDFWFKRNGGKGTWEEYQALPSDRQKEIENFLDNLPYRMGITVDKDKYLLAHACPIPVLPKEDYFYKDARYDAVWDRITKKVPNVIRWAEQTQGLKGYRNFICGHTITNRLTDEYPDHYSIIKEPGNYIGIDCGCKVMGNDSFREYEYECLAALRLDDYKEFYVTFEDLKKIEE